MKIRVMQEAACHRLVQTVQIHAMIMMVSLPFFVLRKFHLENI